MQVSKEFLLEAFGLTLLIGLLLLGVNMFNRATGLLAAFDEQQEQQIKTMQEYEIMQYAGREMDGITAVGYIKKMVYEYEIVICLEQEGNTVHIGREECRGLLEEDSECYVMPFALYTCAVARDENGSIDNILIKRKEEYDYE